MKVGELLTDEGKWTKGAFARRSDGEKIEGINATYACCHEMACRWCLAGALTKVLAGTVNGSWWEEYNRRRQVILEAVKDVMGFTAQSLDDFNDRDHVTFEDVKKVLAAAGEMPESEPEKKVKFREFL